MSVRFAALLGLVLSCGVAQAQAPARTLVVTVRDATGETLPGALVRALRAGTAAAADTDGRARLGGLPADTVAVEVSFVGSETVRRVADLRAGDVELAVTLVDDSQMLSEAVVQAGGADEALGRAAQSVGVLDGAALDAARGETLGETLAALPGVTTLSTGPSIDKPVIRGLHSDRVVVVSGGVRQEGQQWGAEHAPEVDPFAADRIEVVRGAASVEVGVGAIGGVVRLEEAPLPTRPGAFDGHLALQAFSNSAQGAGSVTVEGAPAAVRGLGLRFQASARRAGDARTPDYVLGNTAFFERSAAVTARLARGAWSVEAGARRFATDLGIYSGSHFTTFDALDTVLALGRPPVDYRFSYDVGAPKQSVVHDLATLRGRLALPGGGRVEATYGFQLNRRREYDASRLGGRDPLARPAFALSLSTQTLDARLTTAPRALAGGLAFAVVGAAGMVQGNDSEVGYLIPNFRAATAGAFARGAWARGPLTLEAGTRYDARWQRAFPKEFGERGGFVREVRTYGSLSGVAGAILRLAPQWSIAANASTGWRPPSLNELYSYGVHVGTAQFEVGDSGLGPERSVGADLTLRHESARVSAELSGYATRIADYLFLDPSGELVVTNRGVYPSFGYAQTDASLVGVDGQAEARLGRLTLGASLALVRGTDRTAGAPLLAMPADRAGLRAAFRLPDAGRLAAPTVEVGATLVGRQTRFPLRADATGALVPADFLPPPEGYALLRAGVSTEVRLGVAPARLSLTVENLLDTAYRDYLSRYRFFAHDPGRNVVLRLQVPFGTP